ncbi:MAG: hypothetical protein FWG51_01675, partial [Firmicutes bacterium]|nr:hypothetical protein [Bacillota bacterium]
APAMQNPLISVLPRICIGFTCYLSFLGFKKIFRQQDFRRYLPYIFSGAIGVITNTGLVLSMMFIFGHKSLQEIWAIIITTNTLIEFLCCILVVPTVSMALKRVRRNIDNKNDNILTDSKPDDKNDNLTDKDI